MKVRRDFRLRCLLNGVCLAMALLMAVLATESRAQASRLLEGTVYEADTGQRLAGANIQILGTVLGTSSDSQGRFAMWRIP